MFLKMLVSWLWPWCLMAVAFAEGETQREPSVLRLLSRHPSNVQKARTQWSHYAHEDTSYGQASEGISHGYAVHPQGQTFKNGEAHSEYPTYSASSLPEHRSPSPGNSTVASGSAYGYSRPYLASTGSSNGPFHKDALRGTHPPHYYLQIRPATAGQTALKKILPHYHTPKYQLRNADGFPKTNLKKTALYTSPSVPASYKKLSHPKVHKPFAKHKYPMHKTAHPLYRKYYQSPYQRYAIPFADPLRHKLVPQTDYAHYKNSGSSAPSADGYHTTERMDDAYPDGSAPADDYSHYNDTRYNAGTHYYDAYEDPHKAPPSSIDPYPVTYDETTTRGYYGDRIYMSTHLPLQTPLDKSTTGNAYFILRRTDDDDDDDIPTIFDSDPPPPSTNYALLQL